ncbi:MAG: ribonuclease E/G [Planctomycetaceae bacterium]
MYDEKEPLFHKYHVESEINRARTARSLVPGGRSIVIDQTEEALVRSMSTAARSVSMTTLSGPPIRSTCMTEEVARQIRLRDLGGVIVIDFIDMREKERHRQSVERKLCNASSGTALRTRCSASSRFGLIEMTRQRIRPSLKRNYESCPCCDGTGRVKTAERRHRRHAGVDDLGLTARCEAGRCRSRSTRRRLSSTASGVTSPRLEERYDVIVNILTGVNVGPEHLKITPRTGTGTEVTVPSTKPVR